MKPLLFLCILLLLVSSASAVNFDTEQITLLSVVEFDDGTLRGGTAEFTLQIQPGSGKIFLESYPAAKIDMQVATRLANEYACEYAEVDCNQYDFFYTVRSGSPIIGGSSGGGAATVLTLASLLDVPLRDDVAMTGAISSGGVLTPVSGIEEKVQAAADEGYNLVIIPYLSLDTTVEDIEESEITNSTFMNGTNVTNTSNTTAFPSSLVSMEDFANMSTQVVALLSIPEAFARATDTPLPTQPAIVSPPDYYVETMENTAELLCERTTTLFEQIPLESYNDSLYDSAVNFYNQSIVHADTLYTKASFCFSANLALQRLIVSQYEDVVILENANRLAFSLEEYKKSVETIPLQSFTDLETYVIVTERLLEAQEALDEGLRNDSVTANELGYAIERYESARAWSGFFGKDTRVVTLDQESLLYACYQELQSVETRMSYLTSILPESFLTAVRSNLATAYDYYGDEEYALCLFKATKAKAHANVFFTTLGLEDGQLMFAIDAKQQAAATIHARQAPLFPLLGYSYNEYSFALLEDDRYSALLFAEYAVVFSDVSNYFPVARQPFYSQLFTMSRDIVYFGIGFLFGAFVMFLFLSRKMRSKKRRRR
jgi:predicted S18 family serine protease